MLVLLKGQLLSLFPLINFPFLAWLPGCLSFSLHSAYVLVPKPGREDPPQLGGLLSQAHLRWSPALDLAEKLRWALGRDFPLILLDWHPHTLAHISSIGSKGEWNPILLDPPSLSLSLSLPSLSLSLHFQVLALGTRREDPHSPWALGLVPHLTLK